MEIYHKIDIFNYIFIENMTSNIKRAKLIENQPKFFDYSLNPVFLADKYTKASFDCDEEYINFIEENRKTFMIFLPSGIKRGDLICYFKSICYSDNHYPGVLIYDGEKLLPIFKPDTEIEINGNSISSIIPNQFYEDKNYSKYLIVRNGEVIFKNWNIIDVGKDIVNKFINVKLNPLNLIFEFDEDCYYPCYNLNDTCIIKIRKNDFELYEEFGDEFYLDNPLNFEQLIFFKELTLIKRNKFDTEEKYKYYIRSVYMFILGLFNLIKKEVIVELDPETINQKVKIFYLSHSFIFNKEKESK